MDVGSFARGAYPEPEGRGGELEHIGVIVQRVVLRTCAGCGSKVFRVRGGKAVDGRMPLDQPNDLVVKVAEVRSRPARFSLRSAYKAHGVWYCVSRDSTHGRMLSLTHK